jgi:hypothetical protein
MEFTAQLDVDVVALEAEGEVTFLVSLTAPVPEEIADRPGETLIPVVDRSGSMCGGPIDVHIFAILSTPAPKQPTGSDPPQRDDSVSPMSHSVRHRPRAPKTSARCPFCQPLGSIEEDLDVRRARKQPGLLRYL